MAALQDVDEELPLQTFYRFGGVLFDQVDERRKALFYFEYPELVLQVHGRCDGDDVEGRQELVERLGRMKERVKTVAQVFTGLARRGLEPKAQVEFVAYDAEAAAAAARPKVHASFATRMNSATMQSVTHEVYAAGCEWTTDHTQTEAWFEEWSRKAEEAGFLLVLFTPEYKNRYSEALEREADKIRQVCAKRHVGLLASSRTALGEPSHPSDHSSPLVTTRSTSGMVHPCTSSSRCTLRGSTHHQTPTGCPPASIQDVRCTSVRRGPLATCRTTSQRRLVPIFERGCPQWGPIMRGSSSAM